MPKSQPEFNA